MISIQQVLEWKQAYGDIYQLEIGEQVYIFRPIGREEYKQIVFMGFELGEFQEMICSQSVIYPEDYDYTKGIAGIAEVVSDAILDVSGLHTGQALELLEGFRAEMMNYDYQVDCMIHEAFPEYTLEEISTWPVRKTMFYLSRAEWVLRTLKGVPLEYVQEGEEAQQEVPREAPAPPSPPPPQPREVRKELVEYTPPEPKKQQTSSSSQSIESEEELLAMLAQSGAKVTRPATDMNDIKPELNWFSYMDELKGDFD